MEMANYIMSIFKVQRNIVWSWGLNSPKALQNGIIFKVNGFKHKGQVSVLYCEGLDLFIVNLFNRKGEIIKTIERIYFDQLVEVIDSEVELVQNYNEAVKNIYKIL